MLAGDRADLPGHLRAADGVDLVAVALAPEAELLPGEEHTAAFLRREDPCLAKHIAKLREAAFRRLREHLTEAEEGVALRGRNAHPHHGVPKNQNPQDYADATALECLMGYLYLTGQEARLEELFRIAQEE
jgi:ribonuclease-3 family protein